MTDIERLLYIDTLLARARKYLTRAITKNDPEVDYASANDARRTILTALQEFEDMSK
jgi:hypothetical protein